MDDPLIVVGLQCGDEGKGKIVDYFTSTDTNPAPLIARVNGGPNAGHTVVVGTKTYTFHLLPSGMLRLDARGVLGPGVCVNIMSLKEEMTKLEQIANIELQLRSRLWVDARCPLILNIYKVQDAWREDQRARLGQDILGTTKQGMGPVVAWHALREGLRVGDVLADTFAADFARMCALVRRECPGLAYTAAEEASELHCIQHIAATLNIGDAVAMVHTELRQNKQKIIVEVANGAMLSPRYGMYPYCTSTIVGIAAVFDGLGLTLDDLHNATVLGVVKAYTTAVGTHTLPTQLPPALNEELQTRGRERGTTTNRLRMCGWPDAFQIRYAHAYNKCNGLVLTKIDPLDTFAEVKICTGYVTKTMAAMNTFPWNDALYKTAQPVYITLPGWQCSTTGVRSFQELPLNCQNFIRALETACGIPIWYLANGPERLDMIKIVRDDDDKIGKQIVKRKPRAELNYNVLTVLFIFFMVALAIHFSS